MINDFIRVIEKEFDCFQKLSQNKSLDIISSIESLCLEEEKYIDSLPKSITSLENLSITVHDFYKGDFSDKRFFVLLRFDNILQCLKAKIESESMKDLLCDEYVSYNLAYERFLRKFIKDNLEFRYYASFSSKQITDELILNGFNFDDLNELPFNLDDNDFKDFCDEYLYSEAQNIIMNLFGVVHFNKSDTIFKYNMSFLRFLLLNMNDLYFNELKDNISSSDFYLNSYIYGDISSLFDEANRNPHFPQYSIDIKSFDDLVSLIKFEEILFNNYNSLNLSDFESMRNFLSLVNFESEILSSISIAEYDADKLKDVIGADIDFFLNDGNLASIIGGRIKSLLPLFSDRSSGMSKNYDYVVRNHIINSLNEYRNVICNVYSEDEALKYIDVYKGVIFEHINLFRDVVSMGFDFNILFSLDDVITSKLVGLKSSLNYSVDKDEILYNMGLDLIDEIISLSENIDLFALYQFKICEFGDIINNVSAEHLYALMDKVSSLNASKVRTKLLKKFSFKQYKY